MALNNLTSALDQITLGFERDDLAFDARKLRRNTRSINTSFAAVWQAAFQHASSHGALIITKHDGPPLLNQLTRASNDQLAYVGGASGLYPNVDVVYRAASAARKRWHMCWVRRVHDIDQVAGQEDSPPPTKIAAQDDQLPIVRSITQGVERLAGVCAYGRMTCGHT